jgi:mycothiol system anti-sigma-R factor
MISCREALERIYEYLDGELTDVPADEVQAHFDICQQCFPHLKLEESFLAALQRASAGEAAPPDLRGRVLALLSEADRG